MVKQNFTRKKKGEMMKKEKPVVYKPNPKPQEKKKINWRGLLPFISIIFLLGVGIATMIIQTNKQFNNVPTQTSECENGHIKNKEAIVDWVYEKSKTMPRRQIEDLIPIIDKGHDPLLVIATITYESSWNSSAISSTGAIGLGQIMPLHKDSLIEAGIIKEDVRELFLPEVNAMATQFVITQMRERGNGDIDRCFRFYRGLKINKDGKPDQKDQKELSAYTNNILKAYWLLKHINSLPIKEQEIESGETNQEVSNEK